MISLTGETLVAKIDPKGQLCSVVRDDMEFMGSWQSGEERNHEIVMFPVVGPVFNDTLHMWGETRPMTQHGVSRHIDWELEEPPSEHSVAFIQEYAAGRQVPNRHFPRKGPPFSSFPCSFLLEKRYTVERGQLIVDLTVRNTGETESYHELGWHPSFGMPDDKFAGIVETPEGPYTIDKVERDSTDPKKGALVLPGIQDVIYRTEDRAVRVRSDMGHTMLWSPKGQTQLCIEPITSLPDLDYGGDFVNKPGVTMLRSSEEKAYRAKVDVRRL